MSPTSFFFGPFPKLLLRDHEKNMPRFLSAPSSLLSSVSDLPDLCFLASCWLGNKTVLTCRTGSVLFFFLLPPTVTLIQSKKQRRHLFGSGEGGAVGAGTVLRGRRTAGDLVGVRQRPSVHLGAHALLVKGGLEEARITVELHQVEDLWMQTEGESS